MTLAVAEALNPNKPNLRTLLVDIEDGDFYLIITVHTLCVSVLLGLKVMDLGTCQTLVGIILLRHGVLAPFQTSLMSSSAFLNRGATCCQLSSLSYLGSICKMPLKQQY